MKLKRIALSLVGFLALALGLVGIFLPILPTTPFVLLAAICFSSSSPTLYQRLSKTKLFGDYIENYRNKTGVKKSVKRTSLILLWGLLAVSALVFKTVPLLVILLLVGIGVSAHICLIKERQ